MNINRSRIFIGFSSETLDFLQSVRRENSKKWFEENKKNYQRFLLEPLQRLVMDLGENMLTIDPCFEVRPLVDKTISRIYRDTRFSNDKSLFKDRMWITFKRLIKDWKDVPSYFFEICPHSYRYGMGYYAASKKTMDTFRDAIDSNPSLFRRTVSFYRDQNIFQLQGEKYKRFLSNNHHKEIQDWYQRKSFYLGCKRSIDALLFSPDLVDELISGFRMLKPLYHYLLQSMNIKECRRNPVETVIKSS